MQAIEELTAVCDHDHNKPARTPPNPSFQVHDNSEREGKKDYNAINDNL